jgi:hypothetical protein
MRIGIDPRLTPPSDVVNILALVKDAERYVFIYDDDSRAETLRTLGRFASNPDLSFTWYDAAVLSGKVRPKTNLPADSDRAALAAMRFHAGVLNAMVGKKEGLLRRLWKLLTTGR